MYGNQKTTLGGQVSPSTLWRWGLFHVCCWPCVLQATWPMNFHPFSCLRLLPHRRGYWLYYNLSHHIWLLMWAPGTELRSSGLLAASTSYFLNRLARPVLVLKSQLTPSILPYSPQIPQSQWPPHQVTYVSAVSLVRLFLGSHLATPLTPVPCEVCFLLAL